MKKIILSLLALALTINIFATKYAGEIFNVGAGVKNYALGNTGLTNSQTSSIAYWNPSLLDQAQNQIEIMHAEEFNGLLKFDTISAILGKKNSYSIVITRIAVNDIPLTKLDEDYNRPYEYKRVSTSDIVGYFGFKTKLKNLNLGFTPKFAYRTLSKNTGFGFGADISTYFELSSKWKIAAKIKDFFTTQIFWSDSDRETVFPSVELENKYSFILPYIKKNIALYAKTDISFEGREYSATAHLGKTSFDFHLGLESFINDKFMLFLGYDVKNFTTGISFKAGKFDINYSFEQDSDLNNSHRISLGYRL